MFQPTTKKELQNAVNLWCKDQESVLEKYGDINSWNVSKIKVMSKLFKNKKNFNSDISNWNVSNVRNMRNMFYASSFNKDLSNWNVSSVIDREDIFKYTTMKEEWKPKFK